MGGAQAAEIMTAMGHRQLSTVQRYIHFAENAQQTLAERAATVALKGMAAAASKSKRKVVKL
jgi:site-specific recombinase XerD